AALEDDSVGSDNASLEHQAAQADDVACAGGSGHEVDAARASAVYVQEPRVAGAVIDDADRLADGQLAVIGRIDDAYLAAAAGLRQGVGQGAAGSGDVAAVETVTAVVPDPALAVGRGVSRCRIEHQHQHGAERDGRQHDLAHGGSPLVLAT